MDLVCFNMHCYASLEALVLHVFEVYFSEYKCFVAYKAKLFKPELMFACEVKRWSYFPLRLSYTYLHWIQKKQMLTFSWAARGVRLCSLHCLNNPALFYIPASISTLKCLSTYHNEFIFWKWSSLDFYLNQYFLCTRQMKGCY